MNNAKDEVRNKLFNSRSYIESYLKIKTKNGDLIPFKFNKPQERLNRIVEELRKQGKPIRLIILKARQMGFSTWTEANIFHNTVTKKNVNSMIIAHKDDSTTNLFNMSRLFYDELPSIMQPMIKNSNAKEMIFENPTKVAHEKRKNAGLRSRIRCTTAGGDGVGRSDTIHNLHISEYAFWSGNKEETLNGVLQSVPNMPDTMVVIESTANGYDHFKDLWDMAVKGETDFMPVFFAWYEMPDYSMPITGEFILTEQEQELKELYNLTDEQLNWRRWCIRNNCSNNEDYFKQEFPSNPEEAFLMSGSPVFDTNILIKHKERLRREYDIKPPRKGFFIYDWVNPDSKDRINDSTIRFVDSPSGYINIYEEPEHNYPYVIGGDTKGEGSDFFADTAINNITGMRVATLHSNLTPDVYTYQTYCLGRYYNDALIGIEINFDLYPVIELQRLNYPKQYVRQRFDKYTKETEKKFGWKTDGNTRPMIISNHISLLKDNIDLFTDIEMIDEALTFVYDKNMRPDAQEGKHDDLLFSDMIAENIRSQQTFVVKKEITQNVIKNLPEDILEDYYSAPQDMRSILLKKWGYAQ